MTTEPWPPELDDLQLDDLTVERLCRGLDPADTPPHYRRVAQAIAALRSRSEASEPGCPDADLVALMAASVGSSWPWKKGRRSAKLAALAAAGVMSLTGVAVAARGSLSVSPSIHPPAVTTTTSPSPGVSTTGSSTEVSTSTVDPTTPSPAAAAAARNPGLGSTTRPTTAPTTVACASATNHGQFVSSVAHSSAVTGEAHGDAVSQAAQSSCGKPAASTTGASSTSGHTPTAPGNIGGGSPGQSGLPHGKGSNGNGGVTGHGHH